MSGPARRFWSRRWAGLGLLLVIATAAGFTALTHWMRPEPEAAGGPPTARLISAQQYVNAVRDVFGEDILVEVDFAFPRRQGLTSLGASNVGVTPGLLEQFDRTARSVASQVVDQKRRGLLIPCQPQTPTAPDDVCAERFFSHVGRLLFRRPLSEGERKVHVGAARKASETFGDFYAGLADSLAAMLLSPHFLYFIEKAEPDPGRKDHYRLEAYSKATRLSLFLWNSVPDDALLTAAEIGALHENAEFTRQVDRMLAAPQRIERGARAFFEDLLLFDKFAALNKDPVIYPAFTQEAVLAGKEQALRLITHHLLTDAADYRDLFTTNRSFMNAVLAPIQRVAVEGGGWRAVMLDDHNSAGLVSSLGFLALHSHPGRSSPTLRGKAIREALLCQKVPDPPPNVNFENFEQSLKTVKTARERLILHSTDAACSGCHKITDPIGLALENFDGAGQFRMAENGAVIDASGDLDGTAFTELASFGQALSAHPALGLCLAARLSAYAIGRETSAADRPWLARIAQRFAEDEYRYPQLLRRIVMSRAFYATSLPEGHNVAAAATRTEGEKPSC